MEIRQLSGHGTSVLSLACAAAVLIGACAPGGAPIVQSGAPVSSSATATQGAPSTAPAVVEKWPTSPVTIVLPAGPGSTLDTYSRGFISYFSAALGGAPVVVENRAGGAFIVGTDYVWQQPKDGQTVLIFTEPFFTSVRLARPDLFPKGADSVAFLGAITAPDVGGIMVPTGGKYQSLTEVFDALKKGTKVTLGALPSDPGTYGLFATLDALGLPKPEIIFYTDGGKQKVDLIGGQFDIATANYSGYVQLHQQKQAKFIGFFADKRPAGVPDLPTVGETVASYAGPGKVVPSIRIDRFMAVPLQVKANYPQRYEKLVEATKAFLSNKEFAAWAVSKNFEPSYSTPEAVTAASRTFEELIKKYPQAAGK